MADALGLAEVRFMPAGQPPHRGAPRTDARHRLEMTRRAVAGNSRFGVDDREIRRDAPSYTVESLTALRTELGAVRPVWLLLGADAFLGLPGWHDWTRLFALANIAVAERAEAPALQPSVLPEALRREIADRRVGSADAPAGGVRFLRMTPLAISATAIRDALAQGKSARYLLPDSVLDYIQENHLYA